MKKWIENLILILLPSAWLRVLCTNLGKARGEYFKTIFNFVTVACYLPTLFITKLSSMDMLDNNVRLELNFSNNYAKSC